MAMTHRLPILLLLLQAGGALGGHPCEAEVASACPDSPLSDLADCLKDSSQHEKPTEISSQCTDFMALNTACNEEIESLCDEAFYTEETIPCLAKWGTGEEAQVSEKCSSVMSWAMPEDKSKEEVVTDELGMSDADKAEKKEWQEKRKAVREQAIERMKMKEADAKKEKERVELERFKTESPEAYAEMIAQQEEDKRQKAEFKRKERMRMAALERAKKAQLGEEEDDSSAGKKKSKKKTTSYIPSVGQIIAVAIIGGIVYVVLLGAGIVGDGQSGGGARRSGGKKKRG
eukprot:TRINITY_DN8513_c3_g2_i1.p1 TRINITY_DN8513_c3_g2~~TRINITY_DN8513_c3_g2_i1.p1  ORF type:complete len:288 (+),score=90.62 TRINITY_DN8513_c3_g2_i1:37-900(+)